MITLTIEFSGTQDPPMGSYSNGDWKSHCTWTKDEERDRVLVRVRDVLKFCTFGTNGIGADGAGRSEACIDLEFIDGSYVSLYRCSNIYFPDVY